jgi:hypothetical protein
VTFRYKDYADDDRSKTMTVTGEEFLRRFLQHVLPRSFVKVRHYGLLANRHRAEKLAQCRRLLLPITVVGTPAPTSAAATNAPAETPGCPKCGGCRLVHMELPKEPPRPLTPPPAAALSDTS